MLWAIFASLILHCTLLLIGSLIYFSVGVPSGGSPGGGVGSAVSVSTITQTELGSLLAGEQSAAGPAVESEPESRGSAAALPGVEAGGQATTGVGDLGGVGAGMGGAGSGDGIGIGDGTGGSGGGGAKFFGVEARGQRFAYIVDVSGSMDGGKLKILKDQLITSLAAITDTGSYFVVTFSTDMQPLHPAIRWVEASARNKRDSASAVQRLNAVGGTVPNSAFTTVFSIRPRPDAIYFMTDGQFDGSVAPMVAALNRGTLKVPIHCIGLGDEVGADQLKQIARESGGTFTLLRVGGEK